MSDSETDMEGMAAAAIPADAGRQPGEQQLPVDAVHRETRNESDQPRPGGERARLVPYGALAEERSRRKELQRELQASFDARQQLQDLVESLRSSPDGAAEAAQAVGSQAESPAVEVARVGADAEEESAFRTQVLQSVRNYSRERPDFIDAYHHAREARIEELSLLGYSGEEAASITFDNELEIIRNAYATGRNPAQVIYDYAVRRGYRPGIGEAGRHQSPVARPVLGRMSEAEKVALAARGQAGAKSLSSAGGGATGSLTLEALAGLSDDEFAEATRGDRWQRLLRR